jgi:hypothetical protein
VAVQSTTPIAQPDGTLMLQATNTDGTITNRTTTGAVNPVSVLKYDPTPYVVTAGGSTQLRDGYAVYMMSGTAILGTFTVTLPQNAVDQQILRVVLMPGLTIATLVVKSPSGATVATLTSLLAGATPLFQDQAGTWVKIGS